MTTIVSVVSQKGGVGKSSLARALAVEYAGNTRQRVRVLDFDYGQQTTGAWAQARITNKLQPKVDVQVVNLAKDGYGIEEHAPGAHVIIVDAPGWSDEHTSLLAQQSDFVLIPCGASMDDIAPTIRLVYELVDHAGVELSRIMVVLCRVQTDAEIRAARETIAGAELAIPVAEHVLKELPMIRKAQSGGMAAPEISNPQSAEAVQKLTAELRAAIKKAGKAPHTHEPARYVFDEADLEL